MFRDLLSSLMILAVIVAFIAVVAVLYWLFPSILWVLLVVLFFTGIVIAGNAGQNVRLTAFLAKLFAVILVLETGVVVLNRFFPALLWLGIGVLIILAGFAVLLRIAVNGGKGRGQPTGQ